MRPQSKGKIVLVPRPVLAAMKNREEGDILQSCRIKGAGFPVHLEGQPSMMALGSAQSESESCSVVDTLCNPMDWRVPGILQATILEWVAIPFSRGSSQPRNRTRVSCIAGGFFTN